MSAPGLRVGFIGLGDMGGAIAARIVDAGLPTTLWARRAASLEPFPAAGRASTPAALGEVCDVVGVCVFADDDVVQVLTGPDGVLTGMRAGGVVMVHSTVAPQTIAALATAAAEVGVDVVDAPVSGARRGALDGRLTVIVGGDPAVVERIRPVLDCYATHVRHVGGLGAAMVAKVVNNTLFFAQLHLASTALGLGARLGLDPAVLAEVLSTSSGGSSALGWVPELAAGGRYDEHVRVTAVKDVAVLAQLCAEHGIERCSLTDIAGLVGEGTAGVG